MKPKEERDGVLDIFYLNNPNNRLSLIKKLEALEQKNLFENLVLDYLLGMGMESEVEKSYSISTL